MELKGWIIDCTRSSFQRTADDEVMVFIVDLQMTTLGQFHQYVDWTYNKCLHHVFLLVPLKKTRVGTSCN